MTDTIKQTAKKWTDIAVNGGMDEGTKNCPLCEKYLRAYSCGACPIRLAGYAECRGSIYSEWTKHQRHDHGERNFPLKAKCPACTEIAMRFATWILTLKEEPEIKYPCTMVAANGQIVFFTAPKTGWAIDPKHMGVYSDCFAMSRFKPCKITAEEI